jgi:endonuclease G
MQNYSSKQLRLFHLQTSTLIEVPQNLKRIRIGKPNPNWSPDIDVSNLPNSEIVSSSHAEISVQENTYFLEDLGSTNGTFLNHSHLTPFTPCQLLNGDRIDLGKDELFTFLFREMKQQKVAVSSSSSRNYRQASAQSNNVPMSAHQARSHDNREPNQQKTSSFHILGLILSNLTSVVNSLISFLLNLMSKLIGWRTGMGIRVGVFLIALLVIGLLLALLLNSPNPSTSIHLVLGNPSNASTTDPNNYLMIKPQYAISYNRDQSIPNWVSWQLNQSWLGTVDRSNDFRPDTTLPAGWYQVRPSDYTSSGYDRGHLCPSGDRTRTPEDNSATFSMTNMIPQAPENNREIWRELEEYSRELVSQGTELYIIAGGTGSKRALKGKVTVPEYTWKVIAVLDRPGKGVSEVSTSTRLIAVMMPNSNEVAHTNWTDYRVSVDEVEKVTGYDFFSNVPQSIQAAIESRKDSGS